MNRKQLPAFGIKKDEILKLFSLSPCKKKTVIGKRKKNLTFFASFSQLKKVLSSNQYAKEPKFIEAFQVY